MQAEVLEGLHGGPDRRQGRDADVLDEHVLRGRGAALHAVQHDDVGAGLRREGSVVVGAARPDLHVDGLLPVGDLAQLLELDREIVRTGPVRVAAGRALVDARRQAAHPGDPLGDLLPEQHAAAAGLGALADHHLDGVGPAQVVRVHAVAGGQVLVDQRLRVAPLLRGHAAVARGGRGPGEARAPAEGLLGVGREGAEAHAGDGHRGLQADRLRGEAVAQHHLGAAPLAVALQRVAADRGAEEQQVVEMRERALRAGAADVVDAGRGRPTDLRHDLGGEGRRGARDRARGRLGHQ